MKWNLSEFCTLLGGVAVVQTQDCDTNPKGLGTDSNLLGTHGHHGTFILPQRWITPVAGSFSEVNIKRFFRTVFETSQNWEFHKVVFV